MKTGYYKADTINGVYFYDELLDEPKTNVLSVRDFIDSLNSVQDNEVITTFISIENIDEYNEIVKEYGIH